MAIEKIGRPTSDPKPCRIDFRLNESDFEKLKKYCQIKSISQPEALRQALHLLLEGINL